MQAEIWDALLAQGHGRIAGAFAGAPLAGLLAAVDRLLARAPHGYVNPPLYSGRVPEVRAEAPKPTDRAPTVIIPHAGFLDPELLRPLASAPLHDLIERIVGRDFYLSNTWFQMVPPGTPRLAYHKDPRGSITCNILLDDIAPGMGSTCVVPGSHVNTPPPSLCMANIQAPHPREVDMTGAAGDLLLFSPETWHARSFNRSDRWTRRLFYNFYSRSSRPTTAWHGVIDAARVEAARAVLPPEYAHLFRIDPELTRRLAVVQGGRMRRFGFGASSSEAVLRDAVFGWHAYGRPAQSGADPGVLLPYTTRLVEARPFSVREYVSHVRAVPALRNAAGAVRRRLKA